jgi:hypothetical protein
MPECVKGRTEVMECMVEKAFKNMGFVLVHDGSRETKDINWLSKPTFFTRTLRLKLDGEFVDTWVKFTYDLRTGDADFRISHRDLMAFQDAMEKQDKAAKDAEEKKEPAAKSEVEL